MHIDASSIRKHLSHQYKPWVYHLQVRDCPLFPSICIGELLDDSRLLLNVCAWQGNLCAVVCLGVERRVNVYEVHFAAKGREACPGIACKEGLHSQEVVAIDEAVHPAVAAACHVEGIGYLRRVAPEQSAYVLTWQHQFVGLKPNLCATTEPLQYLCGFPSALAYDARQLFD